MNGGESHGGRLPESFTGPGLVDLQLNGYAGFDFNSPPDLWTSAALHRVKEALNRRGVAAALPTLITDRREALLARAGRYAALIAKDPELAAAFPKLHLEGPFLSPVDGVRGVHPRAHCLSPDDDPDLLSRLDEASGGRIGILTLAPELPGAIALIEQASRKGVCVAIGHTRASAAEIDDAVRAGATMSTHLGNGTELFLPRLDNTVQFQLAADALRAGFIADGIHIPFSTLKNFLRAKTSERSILVTDAVAGADAGPGIYTLGPLEVEVSEDRKVVERGKTNLAGSALTLDRAVINVCTRCGIPFETAWAMASTLPAALISLEVPATLSVEIAAGGFRVKT